MLILDCEKSNEYMIKYIEGTLNEEELLAFSEHIENCPNCMEEFETYCKITAEIGDTLPFEKDDISDEFECKIMKKISGFEFRTEKVLICIIGITSLVVAFIMIKGINLDFVFEGRDFVKNIMESSAGIIEKIILAINVMFATFFKVVNEFLFSLRPFSLVVILSIIFGKIIYKFLRRGGKGV